MATIDQVKTTTFDDCIREATAARADLIAMARAMALRYGEFCNSIADAIRIGNGGPDVVGMPLHRQRQVQELSKPINFLEGWHEDVVPNLNTTFDTYITVRPMRRRILKGAQD
jgi:hypothetical protein